jgi:hypothetical protein
LQITNLVNSKKELTPNGARDLTSMEKRLGKTFAKLEGRWEHLLHEARNRNETVVLSELDNLVQMARFATEQVFPHRGASQTSEAIATNDSLNVVATNESNDSYSKAWVYSIPCLYWMLTAMAVRSPSALSLAIVIRRVRVVRI